jgi:putative addiction module component (TIGR02574 family)
MNGKSTTRAVFNYAIQSLSVTERIQLVEDIWDSITEVPEAIPLTDDQKAELDRRLNAYRHDPTMGQSWDRVRRTITPILPPPNHRRI